jgi:hypothetical protein
MSDSQPPATDRPRYGRQPLPPYSYVPSATPHPVSDPRGHMHGIPHATVPPLDPAAWRDSASYLDAVDLFNHGYYWEAHESWESLWHAAGRRGPIADWLKALIKLAAAAVKAREGNPAGVVRHAERAATLFATVRSSLPSGTRDYCGFRFDVVERLAAALFDSAAAYTTLMPTLLLPHWLELRDG